MIKKEDIKEGMRFTVNEKVSEGGNNTFVHKVENFLTIFTIVNCSRDPVVFRVDKLYDEDCKVLITSESPALKDGEWKLFSLLWDTATLRYLIDNVILPIDEPCNLEQVSHPTHYAWLKDLCGVEPLDICQHLDFCCGSAIKYILRKGKEEKNLTEKQQRIQDLEKAKVYIETEIKLLKDGKE